MSAIELKPYQRRVIVEGDQLAGRLEQLEGFIVSEQFMLVSDAEQDLLLDQRDAMDAYLTALTKRVKLWGRV